MPRSRYAFQAALDDAVACEGRGRLRAFQAQETVDAHRRACVKLTNLARTERAELASGKSQVAQMYAEVARRLEALGAAERERRALLARASLDLELARQELTQLRARRTAIERHRDLLEARRRAALSAREAAEIDEANLSRSGAWNSR
jgi:hypothetical protein